MGVGWVWKYPLSIFESLLGLLKVFATPSMVYTRFKVSVFKLGNTSLDWLEVWNQNKPHKVGFVWHIRSEMWGLWCELQVTKWHAKEIGENLKGSIRYAKGLRGRGPRYFFQRLQNQVGSVARGLSGQDCTNTQGLRRFLRIQNFLKNITWLVNHPHSINKISWPT